MLTIALRIAYLSAISLSLYTSGWLILKADRNRVTAALAVCQILIIIWCIPQLFSALPMTKAIKYLAYALSYVGISFIGPAWLNFAFLYSKRSLRTCVKWGLFLISAVNYSMFLTNECHHLFYLYFDVEQVVYGPFFYGHMLYTYACVLGGMAVVLKDFRKSDVSPANLWIIIMAAAPLAFNILYLSGCVNIGFDLTPPAFALTSVLMLLAVFRYDFLNVNTLAFEQIFASIAEGVVIYNRREKITYCNDSASEWFHVEAGDNVKKLDQIMKGYGLNITRHMAGEADRQREEESGEMESAPSKEKSSRCRTADTHRNGQVAALENGCMIEVKQYTCQDKSGRAAAGILIFTDVGKYFELLEQSRELSVMNQRLAIEQERNRIAQEVHDTAGHTLTMIQSLLKLIQVEYGKEIEKEAVTRDGSGLIRELIKEYISQARELSASGIRDLRCSINNLKRTASCELVTQRLCQLAESVKEFEVEVDIQGPDGPEYSHLSPVVYECFREAVTNCLKYADATHMDLIVKFAGDSLSLYIFDNGRGCQDIAEGNGLKGIRERVEQAKGRVRIRSEAGAGFQIYITFPIEVN